MVGPNILPLISAIVSIINKLAIPSSSEKIASTLLSSPISTTPPLLPSNALPQPAPIMANFELSPVRWVLVGHQIIDGGPTRLAHMFYNASVLPPIAMTTSAQRF
jgi:hypothetical protein